MKTKQQIISTLSQWVSPQKANDLSEYYLKVQGKSITPNARYMQRNLGGVPLYRAFVTGTFVDYTKGEARSEIARKISTKGQQLEKKMNTKLKRLLTNPKDIHYQRPIAIHPMLPTEKQSLQGPTSNFFLHRGTQLKPKANNPHRVVLQDTMIDTTYMSEWQYKDNNVPVKNNFSNNLRYKDNKYKNQPPTNGDIPTRVIIVVNDEVDLTSTSYKPKYVEFMNLRDFRL